MLVDIEARREKVLKIIVNVHINSGVPVSSRMISSHSRIGLCPASVRNVMADLEERGLITHLHTSAGRIPTDKGYRFYVDKLLEHNGLTRQEQAEITKELLCRQVALEEIIHKTSHILSDFTQYAAVVTHPEIKRSCFRRIQFTRLGQKKIFVTLITNTGIVKNVIVCLDSKIEPERLKKIENFMNIQLENIQLSQIKTKLRRMMIQERNSLFCILKQAMEFIDLVSFVEGNDDFYFEGISNMLSFPEFENLEMMRAFVRDLDKRKILAELIQDVIDGELDEKKIRVFIGRENPRSFMNDCAMVLSCYKVNDQTIGVLGIIGPKRMHYGRSIAIVRYVSDLLSDMLTRFTI